MSPQRLFEFLEEGGNMFIGLSSSVSEYWRDFAREFDVDFDDRGTSVYDLFSGTTSSLIPVAPAPLSENVIIGRTVRNGPSIKYNGIGHRRGTNPLLVDVLHAPETAISAEKGRALEGEVFATGQDIGLVSALQTKKNSRVVFSGSVEMLADSAIKCVCPL